MPAEHLEPFGLDPTIRPTISVPEAAAALGISRSAGFNAAHDGTLPVIRLGRRLRVPTAALRRLLQLDEHGPAA